MSKECKHFFAPLCTDTWAVHKETELFFKFVALLTT